MVERRSDAGSTYRLRIAIRHVRPPVWRRIEVPADTTLTGLHDILQTVFGWTDSHLHQFEARGTLYRIPDSEDVGWGPPVRDEGETDLQQILGQRFKRFVYEYDFGDGWLHDITVEQRLQAEAGARHPRCTAGRRACPPEDCGGPWGYARLLAVVADPDHPEHDERREWLGEAFDPEAFDLDAVNRALARRWGTEG